MYAPLWTRITSDEEAAPDHSKWTKSHRLDQKFVQSYTHFHRSHWIPNGIMSQAVAILPAIEVERSYCRTPDHRESKLLVEKNYLLTFVPKTAKLNPWISMERIKAIGITNTLHISWNYNHIHSKLNWIASVAVLPGFHRFCFPDIATFQCDQEHFQGLHPFKNSVLVGCLDLTRLLEASSIHRGIFPMPELVWSLRKSQLHESCWEVKRCRSWLIQSEERLAERGKMVPGM